jgi:hypothetical protein
MSYVQFALNCAQSILLRNDINIYIVSNLTFPIPRHLSNRVFVIPAKAEHVDLGIGMKLYIDEYLQTENTLFIDSDCLCYSNLDEIFDKCQGDVIVAGNIVPAADWVGTDQAQTIKDHFGLTRLIRFNGGLYFIKNTAVAKQIFNTARNIAKDYDNYGFQRIKNKWINEEAPLSIAMMLKNQNPIADNGTFITDLYTDQRPLHINILKSIRILQNARSNHRLWYPDAYSPVILHFGGSNINTYPYISQNILLKLYMIRVPTALATALVYIFIHVPYRCYHWLIGSLRKLKTRL